MRPAGAGADDGGRPPRDATTDRRWYGSDQLRVSAVSSTTKDVCSELSSTPLNEMVAVVPWGPSGAPSAIVVSAKDEVFTYFKAFDDRADLRAGR